MRNFTVLWCLYCEYVWALAFSPVGLSQKISKQSIMQIHFLKLFQKIIGIVSLTTSRSGHFIRGLNQTNIASIHSLNFLDTVDRWILNLYDRS